MFPTLAVSYNIVFKLFIFANLREKLISNKHSGTSSSFRLKSERVNIKNRVLT